MSCGKDYSNKFDENLKKKSQNIFKFSNYDINKFIFLLRKGVYYYEYMDDWEKFNKATLLEKKEFWGMSQKIPVLDFDGQKIHLNLMKTL